MSHKYDGLMLYLGGEEYRAKWEPTAEILIDNEVWEVALYDTLVPLRPRPGKTPSSIAVAMSSIRRCFRGRFVVPHLMNQSGDTQMIKKHEEVADSMAAMRVGVKCFFFTVGRKVVLIRELGKRLDAIGGVLEHGETPIDALIREIFEETGVTFRPQDFVYLGISKEEADGGSWLSHVYISVANQTLLSHERVESYEIDTFHDWNKSSVGRPRAVWMSRHLEFLAEKFKNVEQAWFLLVMTHDVPTMSKIVFPNDRVYEMGFDSYVAQLTFKLHDFWKTIQSSNFDFVPFALFFQEMKKKYYFSDKKIRSKVIELFYVRYLPSVTSDEVKRRQVDVEMSKMLTTAASQSLTTESTAIQAEISCEVLPTEYGDCKRLFDRICPGNDVDAQEFNNYLKDHGFVGSYRTRKHFYDRLLQYRIMGTKVVLNSGGGRIYYRM